MRTAKYLVVAIFFLALENRYSEISSTEPTTMSRESATAFASGTVTAEMVEEPASRESRQASTPAKKVRQIFFKTGAG